MLNNNGLCLHSMHSTCYYFSIGVGSNSVWGGLNVIYSAITAICAACMNINKVSRVNIGGALAPRPPLFLAYMFSTGGKFQPVSNFTVLYTLSLRHLFFALLSAPISSMKYFIIML